MHHRDTENTEKNMHLGRDTPRPLRNLGGEITP